jgi:hypothetical protein
VTLHFGRQATLFRKLARIFGAVWHM